MGNKGREADVATYKVVLEVASEKGAEELRVELEAAMAARELKGKVLALAETQESRG